MSTAGVATVPHAAPAPRWFLLRHAQPLIHAGVCYGQLDVPADAAATAQAANAVAQFLLATPGPLDGAVPTSPLVVHCSPLQRCQQLANALLAVLADHGLSANCHTDPRLAETDFGRWEGQAWSTLPARDWQAWMADFAHYRPGGGESNHTFIARVRQAATATQALLNSQPHTRMLWITHAGVMRALHWMQQHPSQTAPQNASDWPQDGACAYGQWRPQAAWAGLCARPLHRS